MFVPKEIVQNFAMRLPPIKRLAQSRHSTGLQNKPSIAQRLFDEYERLAERDLSGLAILELGPGQGIDLMRYASTKVKTYAAFDIEAYLSPSMIETVDVDYRTDASGNLPWADNSFDLVWSYSVLGDC